MGIRTIIWMNDGVIGKDRTYPPARPLRSGLAAALAAALPVLSFGQELHSAEAATPSAWPSVVSFIVAVVSLGVGAAAAAAVARRQGRLLAELRAARARLACTDALLDAWVWETDTEHRVVAWRPPSGVAASDGPSLLLGSPLASHFDCTAPATLGTTLAGSAPFDDLEVRYESAGTPARTGRIRGRPLTDARGAFAGYLGSFRASPAIEAAPASAKFAVNPPAPAAARAVPTEHESFSFTVSHDLRAPIRVVEGFTKIVKEDYGRLLDRVGNDHLDRVLGAAARMNNMIDALLALSKLSSQPLQHQPVNLSQLATYVTDELRRQAPERRVRVEVQPDMQVQGDPTLLRVVVENLLGNAWKYTGKSEEALIAFTRHPDEPHTFSVTDNGAGFDMRFADRLFGVFQRLHSANDFPGTGVGLASVKRIVRRHGGEIWGEAEVQRGARFHFTLPQETPTE